MKNNSYNYSVSLIRRNNEVWTIDPSEVATRALYQELLTQSPGSSYLAIKTEGELSYCIFLSGEVCHSDICGWIITLNSWRITDLDMHLHLSQEVWRRLAQTPVADTEGRLRHLLLRLIEFQDLIPNSSPIRIDRNVDYQYEIRPFKIEQKTKSVANNSLSAGNTRQTKGKNKSLSWSYIIVFVIVYMLARLVFTALFKAGL